MSEFEKFTLAFVIGAVIGWLIGVLILCPIMEKAAERRERRKQRKYFYEKLRAARKAEFDRFEKSLLSDQNFNDHT